MNNYDYPYGADNAKAPWNQMPQKPMEIDVTVSVTLSKQFTVEVNDYKKYIEINEDTGDICEKLDFSDCDLKEAVEKQCYIPGFENTIKTLKFLSKNNKHSILKDLSNWCIDDFEVIKD